MPKPQFNDNFNKVLIAKLSKHFSLFQRDENEAWQTISTELGQDESVEQPRWQDLRSHFKKSLVYKLSTRYTDDKELIDKLQYPYLRRVYSVTISFVDKGPKENRTENIQENLLFIKSVFNGTYDPAVVAAYKRHQKKGVRNYVYINVSDPRYRLSADVQKLLLQSEKERTRKRNKGGRQLQSGTWHDAASGSPVVLDDVSVTIENVASPTQASNGSAWNLLNEETLRINTQEYNEMVKESQEPEISSPPKRRRFTIECDVSCDEAVDESSSGCEENFIFIDPEDILNLNHTIEVSRDPLQMSVQQLSSQVPSQSEAKVDGEKDSVTSEPLFPPSSGESAKSATDQTVESVETAPQPSQQPVAKPEPVKKVVQNLGNPPNLTKVPDNCMCLFSDSDESNSNDSAAPVGPTAISGGGPQTTSASDAVDVAESPDEFASSRAKIKSELIPTEQSTKVVEGGAKAAIVEEDRPGQNDQLKTAQVQNRTSSAVDGSSVTREEDFVLKSQPPTLILQEDAFAKGNVLTEPVRQTVDPPEPPSNAVPTLSNTESAPPAAAPVEVVQSSNKTTLPNEAVGNALSTTSDGRRVAGPIGEPEKTDAKRAQELVVKQEPVEKVAQNLGYPAHWTKVPDNCKCLFTDSGESDSDDSDDERDSPVGPKVRSGSVTQTTSSSDAVRVAQSSCESVTSRAKINTASSLIDKLLVAEQLANKTTIVKEAEPPKISNSSIQDVPALNSSKLPAETSSAKESPPAVEKEKESVPSVRENAPSSNSRIESQNGSKRPRTASPSDDANVVQAPVEIVQSSSRNASSVGNSSHASTSGELEDSAENTSLQTVKDLAVLEDQIVPRGETESVELPKVPSINNVGVSNPKSAPAMPTVPHRWAAQHRTLESVIRSHVALYGTLRQRWPQLFHRKPTSLFSDLNSLNGAITSTLFNAFQPADVVQLVQMRATVDALAIRIAHGVTPQELQQAANPRRPVLAARNWEFLVTSSESLEEKSPAQKRIKISETGSSSFSLQSNSPVVICLSDSEDSPSLLLPVRKKRQYRIRQT